MSTLTPAEETFTQIHKLQKQALQQAFVESLTPLQREQLASIISPMSLTEATPYLPSGADQASDFFYMLVGQKLPL